MTRYYYDLHMHSALSPCADDDCTPYNLVGMGVLAGLQLMALTDHNTCRNCPAFFEAARRQGIIPVAGMELTTAEDIHMVCLFPTLEAALAFDEEISRRRILVANRPDIFGNQYVFGKDDEVVGEEPYFLSNATSVTVEESFPLVKSFGGVCYPAHIDREANGIIATLGTLPPELPITCVELHNGDKEREYRRFLPKDCEVLVSSDAHFLWDVRDKTHFLELDDEPYSSQKVRDSLIRRIGGIV